jgi:hypothetical protein
MSENPIIALIQLWLMAYRRFPRLALVVTILGVVGIATGGYYAEKVKEAKLEAKRLENQDYAKQIESLNKVRASLQGLLEFVDTEREQIKQTEGALVRLKDEHEKLKPVVEADRSVIDALFAAQEVRNQASQTRERWIGFGLGVLASIIASLVYTLATFMVRRIKAERKA